MTMQLKIKITSSDMAKRFAEVAKKVMSAGNMKLLMDTVVKDIKIRVGHGFGVPKDFATKQKFAGYSNKKVRYLTTGKGKKKKVKKVTWGQFKKADPYKEESDKASSGKANLIYSGQMLDSLTAVGGQLRGEIYLKEKRKRLKIDGKRVPTNSEIAEGNSKKRPWLHVSDEEYKRLIQKMEKQLNIELKKIKLK
jgi:hypothetical protein